MGWDQLSNGELISEAENEGFNLLITTDQNLRYQQNLDSRRLSILVLLTTSWPRIQKVLDLVILETEGAAVGSYAELQIP